jgi:3-hydroxyisobutyrate dehydrogenase-like beta-hydroxyacid dehydrogenase
MTRVAFLGLGTMGSRIAAHLVAEHDLVVWNRDGAKTVPLVELGATAASTPAGAARGSEVVVTMVSDAVALASIADGERGFAGAVGSATVIQMSTVGLPALERLREALPDRAQLLDAPVLGSVPEAEAGTLTIFAGGPADVVDRWSPLLSLLGTVLHVGPLGAGTAAKLVANAGLFGILGVLGEAIGLADGLGLDRSVTFDVLAATPLAAQADRRRPAVESDEYPPRFALSLALKDQELVIDAAAAAGVELRVAPAVHAWLDDARRAGLGAQDYSAVLRRILEAGDRAQGETAC